MCPSPRLLLAGRGTKRKLRTTRVGVEEVRTAPKTKKGAASARRATTSQPPRDGERCRGGGAESGREREEPGLEKCHSHTHARSLHGAACNGVSSSSPTDCPYRYRLLNITARADAAQLLVRLNCASFRPARTHTHTCPAPCLVSRKARSREGLHWALRERVEGG